MKTAVDDILNCSNALQLKLKSDCAFRSKQNLVQNGLMKMIASICTDIDQFETVFCRKKTGYLFVQGGLVEIHFKVVLFVEILKECILKNLKFLLRSAIKYY